MKAKRKRRTGRDTCCCDCAQRDNIRIVVGDYRATNPKSMLAYLEALSEDRKDGGLPDPFPLDLPERIDAPDFVATDAMNKALGKINEGLIIPVGGGEICEIIRLAREYAALRSTGKKGGG